MIKQDRRLFEREQISLADSSRMLSSLHNWRMEENLSEIRVRSWKEADYYSEAERERAKQIESLIADAEEIQQLARDIAVLTVRTEEVRPWDDGG